MGRTKKELKNTKKNKTQKKINLSLIKELFDSSSKSSPPISKSKIKELFSLSKSRTPKKTKARARTLKILKNIGSNMNLFKSKLKTPTKSVSKSRTPKKQRALKKTLNFTQKLKTSTKSRTPKKQSKVNLQKLYKDIKLPGNIVRKDFDDFVKYELPGKSPKEMFKEFKSSYCKLLKEPIENRRHLRLLFKNLIMLETIIKYESECKHDEEISKKTGRCIKKCKPGQERNPKTNRCKKMVIHNKVVVQEDVKEESVSQSIVKKDVKEEPVSKSKLYNDNIVFQFYSKSADKQPGKGAGEKIPDSDRSSFAELASMKNWRHVLSNFYPADFELDGHTWKSVEHYYQASKFKENNPKFYESFSLDMNPDGDLSTVPAMAKGAGGKTGNYRGKLIRPKDVKIDPNFFSGRHKQEMKVAQGAKFSQNPELTRLLLATKDAKLTHFVRGAEPVVFTELMEVRRELAQK